MAKKTAVKKSLIKMSKVNTVGKEENQLKNKKTKNNPQVDKMPLAMKISISVLSAIILGLFGYILYQAGQGSVFKKQVSQEISSGHKGIPEEAIGNNSANTESSANKENINNIDDGTAENGNTSDLNSLNNPVDNVVSNNFSEEDIKNIEVELDNVSSEYDALEDMSDILKSWLF